MKENIDFVTGEPSEKIVEFFREKFSEKNAASPQPEKKENGDIVETIEQHDELPIQ